MTRLTTFDINRLTPYAVGFDRVLEQMQQYHKHQKQSTGFPPYNIRKESDTAFFIDMAVAGLTKDDVEVEYAQGEVTIRSTYDNAEGDVTRMLHKGISMKKFNRTFTLADDIIVNGAELKNGMLVIELERIIPDEKKPKLIEIQ
jgi:molecular chaperone IbpA